LDPTWLKANFLASVDATALGADFGLIVDFGLGAEVCLCDCCFIFGLGDGVGTRLIESSIDVGE
jgi:hypothetical protein